MLKGQNACSSGVFGGTNASLANGSSVAVRTRPSANQPKKRTLAPGRREGRSLRKMRVVGTGPLLLMVVRLGVRGAFFAAGKVRLEVCVMNACCCGEAKTVWALLIGKQSRDLCSF